MINACYLRMLVIKKSSVKAQAGRGMQIDKPKAFRNLYIMRMIQMEQENERIEMRKAVLEYVDIDSESDISSNTKT